MGLGTGGFVKRGAGKGAGEGAGPPGAVLSLSPLAAAPLQRSNTRHRLETPDAVYSCPATPIVPISPFFLCWCKDSRRSRVRDCIQLKARARPKDLCPELSLHGSGWIGATPRCRRASTPPAPGSLCLRVISSLRKT